MHIEELDGDDILAISTHLYPNFDTEQLRSMILFNFELHNEVVVKHSFGRIGAPWEFNLRDLMRWLDLLHTDLGLNKLGDPIEHLASLYVQRFRTASDRRSARELFKRSFPGAASSEPRMMTTITANHVRIGHAVMPREPASELQSHRLALLQSQLPVLEALIDCVQKKWLSILVGPTGSGKTSVVRLVAQFAGARLEEFQMNSGTDTMDLIGTFEQFDPSTRTRSALAALVREAHRLSEQVAARSHSRYASFLTAQGTLKAALGSSQSSPSSELLSAALEDVRNATGDVSDEVFRTTLENAVAVVTEMTQNTQDAQKSTGRFEWIDGPLLRALQEGHWLMLDNANLCSASVLDRLNSLFEPNGCLVISERGVVDGKVPVIRPHPNFRVFMCLDPRHGELSRAMRNRGIEIALLPKTDSTSHDLDSLAILSGCTRTQSLIPSRSTQDELMEAAIQAQLTQRAILTADMLPDSKGASQRRAAAWAASQLPLQNSSLASTALPLYLAGAGEHGSPAAASLLVRLSSSRALALALQVLQRCFPSASGNSLSLLQEVVSSGRLSIRLGSVFDKTWSTLVVSRRNLLTDLRSTYDTMTTSLIFSSRTVCPLRCSLTFCWWLCSTVKRLGVSSSQPRQSDSTTSASSNAPPGSAAPQRCTTKIRLLPQSATSTRSSWRSATRWSRLCRVKQPRPAARLLCAGLPF